MNNAIILVARLLLAQLFLLAGLSKISGYAATQAYMEGMGVPSMLLPLVILLEVGGGLALILGILTRWTAMVLAAFCVLAAVLFHSNLAEQAQVIMFMKDFAITGGLLMLYVHGPGAFSLDARRAG